MNEIKFIQNGRTCIAQVFDAPPAGADRIIGAHTAKDYDDGYYDLYIYREPEETDYLRYAAVWRDYETAEDEE